MFLSLKLKITVMSWKNKSCILQRIDFHIFCEGIEYFMKIADFNIAKSLIDLLDKKITIEDLEKMVSYDGKVSFLKDENGILDIKVEK